MKSILDKNFRYVPGARHATENVVAKTIRRELKRLADEAAKPSNVKQLKKAAK